MSSSHSDHYSVPYSFNKIEGLEDLTTLEPGNKVLLVHRVKRMFRSDFPSADHSIYGTVKKNEHGWLEINDYARWMELFDVRPGTSKYLSDKLRSADSHEETALAINLTNFPNDPNLEL